MHSLAISLVRLVIADSVRLLLTDTFLTVEAITKGVTEVAKYDAGEHAEWRGQL